jgi:hypothetical protein
VRQHSYSLTARTARGGLSFILFYIAMGGLGFGGVGDLPEAEARLNITKCQKLIRPSNA